VSGRPELLRLASELRADLASADERALGLSGWTDRLAVGDEAYVPAGLLHHLYTAIEAAARRAVLTFDGSVPGGSDSHARLLEAASVEVAGIRPALFSAASRERLRELLDFRHLYRHGYGIAFDAERIRDLARRATALWPQVRGELEAMARFAESCGHGA